MNSNDLKILTGQKIKQSEKQTIDNLMKAFKRIGQCSIKTAEAVKNLSQSISKVQPWTSNKAKG